MSPAPRPRARNAGKMNVRIGSRYSRRALCRRIGALGCVAVMLGGQAFLPRAASAQSSGGRKRRRLSQTLFFTMKPLAVPIFRGEEVIEHFTVVIALELADPDRRREVYRLVPRLRDAFYRILYRLVTFRRKGSPMPHVEIIKRTLYETAAEIAGPELVSSLLVQQAFNRRVR